MSPEVIVETSSLGTPIGSERRTADTMADPPLPPRPMTPSQRPSARQRGHERRGTAGHRLERDGAMAPGQAGVAQLLDASCPRPVRPRRRPRPGRTVGSPRTPTSTRVTATPASRRRSRTKACSGPLVSSVPERGRPFAPASWIHCRSRQERARLEPGPPAADESARGRERGGSIASRVVPSSPYRSCRRSVDAGPVSSVRPAGRWGLVEDPADLAQH